MTDITQKSAGSGSEYVRIAIIFFDFLLVNLLFIGFLLYGSKLVPEVFEENPKIVLMVLNFAMIIAEYYFHTIVQHRLIGYFDIARNVFKLVGTHTILMFGLMRLVTDAHGFFRFGIIFTVSLYVLLMFSRLAQRWVLNWLRKNGHNTETVLLVGHDLSLARLYKDLTQSASVGYKVRGYYADREMKNCPEGLNYLGSLDDLNKLLDAWDAEPTRKVPVHEIFCSLPHDQGAQVRRIMHSCDKSVIRFFYVPRIFEDYALNLQMQRFGDYNVFASREEPLRRPMNRIAKRFFDVCVSLLVCICLLPVIVVVGIIIKMQSPGPIFFRQKRTGMDGATFDCFKFRSMHVNVDSDKLQATENDPRKFAFGNFMRKTNIDEFPQFFNVLRGDMSIVGPRPHMLHHTEVYGKLIDKYMVRHFCRPGITGWAQVTGFRGETKELWQMEQRVERDIWYLEHWSFLLDLKIMYLTAKSIFVHDEHAY